MKKAFAILLSCLFLLTSMQQTTIYLLYKINQESITEQYCVNKNVKNSCCKGSCHLEKTIAKANDAGEKNPFSSFNIKTREIEIICTSLQITHFENGIITLQKKSFYNYTSPVRTGILNLLLKPPCDLG